MGAPGTNSLAAKLTGSSNKAGHSLLGNVMRKSDKSKQNKAESAQEKANAAANAPAKKAAELAAEKKRLADVKNRSRQRAVGGKGTGRLLGKLSKSDTANNTLLGE